MKLIRAKSKIEIARLRFGKELWNKFKYRSKKNNSNNNKTHSLRKLNEKFG